MGCFIAVAIIWLTAAEYSVAIIDRQTSLSSAASIRIH